MAETLRLFIGVPLTEEMRDRARRVQQRCKPYFEKANWVDPANFHLTLKFLGPVSADRIPEIRLRLRKSASETPPFEVVLRGCGAFPGWRRPRVLWIGVEHNPALWDLASRVEHEMTAMGFEPERRRYAPHLTLARIKRARPGVVEKFLEREHPDLNGMLGGFPVSRFVLFESRLHPRGAEYHEVEAFPLAG